MKRQLLLVGLLFLGASLLAPNLVAENNTSLTSVRVETLGDHRSTASRRFVGRIDAVSSVDLSFQVGGQLLSLPVRQGSQVETGSLLAQLDPTNFQLAVEEAKVRLNQAERDLRRKQTLLENNSVSPAVVDEARDQLRLAELGLNAARRNLSFTRIEAPFNALITRRLVDPYVNLSAGTPVVRIQDVTELRVHISVPEDLVRKVNTPDQVAAELLLPGREEQPLALEYREHATEPDRVVQTYQVTFGFQPPEGMNLLPGMTATVRVTPTSEEALHPHLDLPASAINASSDGTFFVWVFQPQSGTVEKRQVEVGRLAGDRIEILAGAEAGEQVVTAGGTHLHPGMRVRPFSQF
ncbi:efflux RND transporter periplasmic adaptor subunit [Marinospirillum perlucidum]|uniref:efflux RND transporter periplasmic adaptor subunit n=1 Tax=Marinospirillum perlucidum TaxID=1982602 RepID=UPI000DF37B9B|nr:efflux RND transporter periplasmic adaptor subunit [Marinospirillum perlucidum]